jgi:toxin-antitoxin system PIN domain toxin
VVIPDANILIYSHNPGSPHHSAAVAWLNRQFESSTLGFTWPTCWAFLRIASNPRLFARPASPEQLFDRLEEWLSHPAAAFINPGSRHAEILRRLVLDTGIAGTLISDAVLAAVAIEHAATLASTDRDFRRFSGLRWIDPLDQA